MTEQQIEPRKTEPSERPGFLRWKYGSLKKAGGALLEYALIVAVLTFLDSMSAEPDGFWPNAGAVLTLRIIFDGFDYQYIVVQQQTRATTAQTFLKLAAGVLAFLGFLTFCSAMR